MNRIAIRAVLVSVFCTLASAASAVPITFIHQGVGSGTLAGTPFSTRDFTIFGHGDTSQRVAFASGYFIDHTSAQIEILGVGLFTFTTPTRTFVNNIGPSAGFSRAGLNGLDLFDLDRPEASVFAAWDMTTAIGPVSGTGFLTQWDTPVTTSGGVLFFNPNSTVPAIFTAVIPEPGGATLLITALVTGLCRRRRSPV
jgi:hypothetical protein